MVKVLVVEDEASIREMIALNLRLAGMEAVEAESAEAALPLLPPQITHLGATVSPDNSYSLHNAQASGFVIRCRREMYGGYDRYLLEKQL